MTFHTRNPFPQDEIEKGEEASQTQSEKILTYFREHPDAKMTPFDVAFNLFTVETPITSIRRALTDLTTEGHLEKLEEQVKERYGVSNCRWHLAPKTKQTELF